VARRDARSVADYSSGISYFHAKRQGKDFVALLPLETFLRYFGEDPVELANTLSTKADVVVSKWLELNKTRKKGERKPISWIGDIATFEWRSQRGKQEKSIFEIQINSYAATGAVQYLDHPVIDRGCLKLLIKVRSTVTFDSRPDKSGQEVDTRMSLDNRGDYFNVSREEEKKGVISLSGYNVNLLHFMGLLRSHEFRHVLDETRVAYLSAKLSGVIPVPAKIGANATDEKVTTPEENLGEEEEEEEDEGLRMAN